MSRFDRKENPDLRKIIGIEGTGDGLDPLSKLTEIKSKGDKDLIGANRKTPDRPSPVPFGRSKYPPPSIHEQMRRRFHEAQERARLEHEALCALHNDDFDDCA